MEKIIDLFLGSDYLLTVRLDTGQLITIDLKKKLFTVRFSDLRDKAIFQAAATDGKTVYWPGGLSLTISEIRSLAQKNK